MTFYKFIQVYCLALLMVVTGCEKQPLNSDVEGHWRLEQFTILATGEIVPCRHLYYGITRMVTEVSRKTGDKNDVAYVARTTYKNVPSTIVLSDFKVKGYNTDTGENATVSQMKPFGIIEPQETVFLIIQVNHHKMILESSYSRLELSKF